MIYLNHAGTSWPKPKPVLDAVSRAASTDPLKWPQEFERCHRALASFLGISNLDQLLITPGCTSSLTNGIASADLADKPCVVTSPFEHQAMHGPLVQLTQRDVELRFMKTESNGQINLNHLEETLSKRDVGLVAFTAACNVTGDLLPCESIIALAKRYDAMVFIDAAQVIGWFDLNLPQWGADIVAFGTHKGMQCPWGIGGLYVSESAQTSCLSAQCELPSLASPSNEKSLWGSISKGVRPGYCDVGSVDQMTFAGVAAAVDWLNQKSRAEDLATARSQIQTLVNMARESEVLETFGLPDVGSRLPSLAVRVNCPSHEALQSSATFSQRLREKGIIAASGHQCSPLSHRHLGTEATGLVRFSVGIRQEQEEIHGAVDRIRELVGTLV